MLTNIADIWTLPTERKTEPHRMRTEVVIYYFDRDWNVAWGECNGQPTFLPIGSCPVFLKPGQRVLLDGWVIPGEQTFIWERTQVRVLEEGLELKARPVRRLYDSPQELHTRLVEVEGLVDRLVPQAGHVTLDLLADGLPAKVHVLTPTDPPSMPCKEGDFVRLKAVCGVQFNHEGGVSSLSLWVASPSDLEAIGNLATDTRFNLPLIRSEEIVEQMPLRDLVCVQGVVRRHQPGQELVLWDATGQIIVRSRQVMPVRVGELVEAIGRPYGVGVRQYLRDALYRPSVRTNTPALVVPDLSGQRPLRLAEWIQGLSPDEAGRRLPVHLRAVITWAHPEMPFAWVEDASGGVRVDLDSPLPAETAKAGTVLELTGVTAQGPYTPVVTNATFLRIGWRNPEPPPWVSWEQAMTGAEVGRWIRMQGYVRAVSQTGTLARLELSTERGPFRVWLNTAERPDYLRGSVVQARGVCGAVTNPRGQLTSIELWCPGIEHILVEEPAPDDIFAVPLQPLRDLRRFRIGNNPHRRIRTGGTVTFHLPGRCLFVQEGQDCLFVVSPQTDPLQPGDRIEVVGFPGHEGRRFLLREAFYRRRAAGTEPPPLPLAADQDVNPDWSGLLARGEGTLLSFAADPEQVALVLQNDGPPFHATLDLRGGKAPPGRRLQRGSLLRLTGVYEAQWDEDGNPRTFQLRRRSWDDIQVLRHSPWWTLRRLAGLLLATLLAGAGALAWALTITRKNRLLREAQAALQAAHDRLEVRVLERTRELEQQVRAKEQAHAELARAQDALMLASRQAGMAEVATGVIHNVGNVLNSVSVSASLMEDRLARSRTDLLTRATRLLQQPADQLGRFLQDDPKGKVLPTYLDNLAAALQEDRDFLRQELRSLRTNLEHIENIVATQQQYAKVAGVLEPCDPRQLLEDALRIHAASLDQHRIELVRDYQPTPPILVDRHKALQILVNLVSNAKHALISRPADRRLELHISQPAQNRVRLQVRDNGTGIAPENLSRIFAQGFTTRRDGHGFGLHSSANAARQMGGTLTAASDGPGHGATFTLELPTAPAGQPGPTPPRTEPNSPS